MDFGIPFIQSQHTNLWSNTNLNCFFFTNILPADECQFTATKQCLPPPSVRSPKCHPNKLPFFRFKVTLCSGFSGPITNSALCLGFNVTQSRTQNKPAEHCRDLRKPRWPLAVNLSFIVFNQIHQLFSSTSVTAAKEKTMTECLRLCRTTTYSLAAHWLKLLSASRRAAWRVADVMHFWAWTLYIVGAAVVSGEDAWRVFLCVLMCLYDLL